MGRREKDQRATLLTITSIMATLRYTDPEQWIETLRGRTMFAESPLCQKWAAEIVRETRQEFILRVMAVRFGAVPDEVKAQVFGVTDLVELEDVIRHSARCAGFDDFRKRLARS